MSVINKIEKQRDYAYNKARARATTTKQKARTSIKIRFLPIARYPTDISTVRIKPPSPMVGGIV